MKLQLINEILTSQPNEAELHLRYHDTLNPQIWQENNQLKPVIREHLLKIANFWTDFAQIPAEAVADVVLTGSLANYNYTPMSDFDLHVNVHMDKLPIKDETLRVKNIFHMKALWAKTHPDIKIYGYPVELFAEDVNTRHPLTQGVYSLKGDQWVHMPTHEDINYENDANLKSKVKHFQDVIDDLVDNDRSLERIKSFKEKLRNMRGDSIQKHGELRGVNNLVFKELRNRGCLDKLSQHETKKFDHEMSIHEAFKIITEAKKPKEPVKTFKDYLVPIPHDELLDHHVKFGQREMTLPDNTNLHKHLHNDKIVAEPLENGGYIIHSTDSYWPGTEYQNAKGDPHREDGPAQINAATGEHYWSLHGAHVAKWSSKSATGMGPGGWVANKAAYGAPRIHHFNKDSFNKALAEHGFPAFDPSTVKKSYKDSYND